MNITFEASVSLTGSSRISSKGTSDTDEEGTQDKESGEVYAHTDFKQRHLQEHW